MRTDFLIVADGAQVAEGKLYLMGGGWNRVTVSTFPATINMGVAVGILVSWDETNEPHMTTLTLEDEDGQSQMNPVEMRIEVGRPAGAVAGEEQRVLVAVNGPITLNEPGGYSVIARLGDAELARTSFRAVLQ